MAENVTNELLLENLKAIRDELGGMRGEMAEVRGEMRAMKSHLLGLVQSDLTRDSESATIKARLDVIERRLGLAETSN
ncbi:MAG: hypothetical protein AAFR98_12120 [Pseudomonadota bacterium]